MVLLKHSTLAILLVLLGTACGHRSPAPPAKSETKVIVRKPNRLDRPFTVSASGNVEPHETGVVGFSVAGRVARALVREGDSVSRGQLLAELETADYTPRVQAAAAQTGAARATLEKAEHAVRPQELAQAKVDLDRTTDEYNRLKTLYDRKSLPPADFKKIEAAYLAARQRYSLAEEGARREDKQAAFDALEGAQAQETLAKKALDDTRLTAPFAGVIAKREIHPGDTVAPGRPAFILLDLDPAEVAVAVPEGEITRIRVGQRATVRIPSLNDQTFAGKIASVGYLADATSRTFTVRAFVANPKLILRAGMIAEAQIETGTRVAALTVPGGAIVRDPQGATMVYVYFPDRRRVYARRIDTGSVYGTEIEVRRGLNGDEQIVVAGQQSISEGAEVQAELTQ